MKRDGSKSANFVTLVRNCAATSPSSSIRTLNQSVGSGNTLHDCTIS